jgi:UTP-glucose-1-phosphate uridylyltransferase
MNNYIGESEVINEFFAVKDEVVNTVHICWRGAKAKRMKMALICEQVLPKQVFGDHIKHNQLLKSLLEFAILTGDMGSEISINVSLLKFIHGASIEYKFIYYSKTLTSEELENIFRIRKHSKKPKVLEEMIEICEKYGLGISIFDVLLTIINGYVGEILVQDSIHRVIISYV